MPEVYLGVRRSALCRREPIYTVKELGMKEMVGGSSVARSMG